MKNQFLYIVAATALFLSACTYSGDGTGTGTGPGTGTDTDQAYTLTTATTPTEGGSVYVDGDVSTGSSTYGAGAVVTATAVAKSGYMFTGWSGASTSTDAAVTVTMDGDITLTANFEEQGTTTTTKTTTYTLTANAIPANGGTVYVGEAPSTGTSTHDSGATVAVTAVANDGYTFTRWSGASTSTADSITIAMRGNRTLTANFQPLEAPPQDTAYTLTTSASPEEGGTVLINGEASSGTSTHDAGELIALTAEAKEGYTFTGWSGASTSTNISIAIAMNSDLTLTANFEEEEAPPQEITYKLTTSASPTDGGSVIVNGTASTGLSTHDSGAVVTATALARTGYRFTGWSGASTATTTAVTVTMNGDLTLTANFQVTGITYTVTFNVNSGTPTPPVQNVAQGGKATQPADPTRSTYAFGGWYSNSALTTAWDFDVNTVTANTTLYAKWTRVHTITFDANGGSPTPPTQNVLRGEKIARPTDPTLDGHTLDGWYNTAALTTEWDFEVDTVSASITLRAKWTPVSVTPTTFTVTFNSNGGSDVAPLTAVASGAKITAPTPPTREDYTFDKWYKEATFATEWIFGTDAVTANVTLYAKWTPVSVTPTTFTVTFNSNDGSSVAPLTAVASGDKITAPTPPTREGYTFGGWYKEATFATEWIFGTDAVTANVTLFAKWTPISVTPTTFTVTFVTNGGTPVPNVQNVASGDKATAPADITRDGFTLYGWYEDAEWTKPWDFVTDEVTADVTLYAKWTEDGDPPDDDPPPTEVE